MNKRLHFVIYGVGAVGGTYGAQLAYYKEQKNLDYNLSFLARNKTLEVLSKEGISLDVINETTETRATKGINVVAALSKLNFADDEYPVFLLCASAIVNP